MADRRVENMAIPLCLPNNCQWNAATGEYIKTGEKRSSLYVVDEALQKLRTVRGEHYTLEINDSLYLCIYVFVRAQLRNDFCSTMS